jgi:hypothetical protein
MDDYFGVCPTCQKTDGYTNVGRSHWFFCKEHRVKWWVGSNLFSSWQGETEEYQRRRFDEIGLGEFETIKAIYPEQRKRAIQEIIDCLRDLDDRSVEIVLDMVQNDLPMRIAALDKYNRDDDDDEYQMSFDTR